MKDSYRQKREELIKYLTEIGRLKDKKVANALRSVPRHLFVPPEAVDYAYSDCPMPIGHDATISAPHIVVEMLQLLELNKTDKVLEVGTGSGWNAALLSKLAKTVYTIEAVPELVEFARANLKKIQAKNVRIICRDGTKGYPEKAPYDKIIVTCGIPDIPRTLVNQLKGGGKLVAPVGGDLYQTLVLAVKIKGKLQKKNYGTCAFVPVRR